MTELADVLLTIPNVSEGRDAAVIAAIGKAFGSAGARLLDTHADPDHHRSVYTLAAAVGEIAPALVAGARECLARLDLRSDRGSHPHVGVLDVAPVVYLNAARRGAACAEALVAGEELGRAGLPVFLYGELAGGRTRADLRRGGLAGLAARVAAGELAPDFGPHEALARASGGSTLDPRTGGRPGALDPRAGRPGALDPRAGRPGALDPRAGRPGALDPRAGRPSAIDPRAGAVLVAARPPLVAFNIELAAPASLADAQAIAAAIREGGLEGLPGVRALGLELPARGGVAQVSTNVEDHLAVPLAKIVEAVAKHAHVAGCELVGLAPAAAFEGFPEEVAVRNLRTVEDALAG